MNCRTRALLILIAKEIQNKTSFECLTLETQDFMRKLAVLINHPLIFKE